MWEEGARIYGTPGVPNNFPREWIETSCCFHSLSTNKSLVFNFRLVFAFQVVQKFNYFNYFFQKYYIISLSPHYIEIHSCWLKHPGWYPRNIMEVEWINGVSNYPWIACSFFFYFLFLCLDNRISLFYRIGRIVYSQFFPNMPKDH